MFQLRFLPLFCSLILGALMPLSFAPFNLAMIAPFSLVGLLFLLYRRTAKFAALLGLVFGFGMFSWGIWWIRISLIEFGGAPVVVGVFITFLLALYLALFYAILAFCFVKFRGALAFKAGVLFPLLAILLEWLRAELFTGFPWLALGYSLTDLPISQLIFPQMGALMASFWVYWLAGMLFVTFQGLFFSVKNKDQNTPSEDHQKRNKKGREKRLGQLIKPLMPAFLSLGFMGGALLITSNIASQKIEKLDESLNVALLQGNIAQELKFNEAQYYEILATYLKLTDDVAKSADLIIWPETAIPALYDMEISLGEHLRLISQEYQTKVMTGIFSGSGETIRNSIVTYSDKMRMYDQRYDKTHLVPFGEYIPFRSFLSLFSGMIEIPFSDLTQGKAAQAPFEIEKSNGAALFAGASICYEAVFGNELRYQAQTSNLLVNVSNDAWFGDSIGPWQHFQIARARAIELQREMVRATNNGITAWVAKDGSVKALLPQFEEGVLVVDVTSYTGVTAYARLGDAFWGILAIVGLILGVLWQRYRSLKPRDV